MQFSPNTESERFLPVAAPALVGNEKRYVMDCLETSWISSNGVYIDRFENLFAEFCGTKHAIAVCNGTVALHVALLAMDIGPGDEILVPTLTFVATANAVSYCGATPVFVDCEPDTWNIDVGALEEKITSRTKGIIAVHLFGLPVDMDAVLEIAQRHNLFVIEDAAEAHGAEYKGKRAGQLGQIGTFSFYGNKIITTGEGGMIVTNDDTLARKMRQIKGQGQDPARRYWFPRLGYNYRMTNIQAAIGLAQLECIDWHMQRRYEIASWYEADLGNQPSLVLQADRPWAKKAYWINSVVLGQQSALSRDEVMQAMAQKKIETRPFFYPMHTLPMYQPLVGEQQFPTADICAARGISLPSSADLTRNDVTRISQTLLALIGATND